MFRGRDPPKFTELPVFLCETMSGSFWRFMKRFEEKTSVWEDVKVSSDPLSRKERRGKKKLGMAAEVLGFGQHLSVLALSKYFL